MIAYLDVSTRARYRMAGNISGNYIVRFHEKFNAFLFAELNTAFYSVHSVTPTRRASFSA